MRTAAITLRPNIVSVIFSLAAPDEDVEDAAAAEELPVDDEDPDALDEVAVEDALEAVV